MMLKLFGASLRVFKPSVTHITIFRNVINIKRTANVIVVVVVVAFW